MGETLMMCIEIADIILLIILIIAVMKLWNELMVPKAPEEEEGG